MYILKILTGQLQTFLSIVMNTDRPNDIIQLLFSAHLFSQSVSEHSIIFSFLQSYFIHSFRQAGREREIVLKTKLHFSNLPAQCGRSLNQVTSSMKFLDNNVRNSEKATYSRNSAENLSITR